MMRDVANCRPRAETSEHAYGRIEVRQAEVNDNALIVWFVHDTSSARASQLFAQSANPFAGPQNHILELRLLRGSGLNPGAEGVLHDVDATWQPNPFLGSNAGRIFRLSE